MRWPITRSWWPLVTSLGSKIVYGLKESCLANFWLIEIKRFSNFHGCPLNYPRDHPRDHPRDRPRDRLGHQTESISTRIGSSWAVYRAPVKNGHQVNSLILVFIICHLPHYNDAQRFWQEWPHWKFALLIFQSPHWQSADGLTVMTHHVTSFCIRLPQIRLQTWLPLLLYDQMSFRNF